MRDAPVVIRDYDPSWPERFAAERLQLDRALERWLAGPIEHVGSTAVPGLAAKPVIDIMAAVASLEVSRPAIQALAPFEYIYFPYRPTERHWFCKPSPAVRTYHLHLVPRDSEAWSRSLAFRDYLREHPTVAHEYAALKRALAERHRIDREGYTDAKGPFVQRILKASRRATANHVAAIG